MEEKRFPPIKNHVILGYQRQRKYPESYFFIATTKTTVSRTTLSNYCQPRILYPAKLPFNIGDSAKSPLDMQNLKTFTSHECFLSQLHNSIAKRILGMMPKGKFKDNTFIKCRQQPLQISRPEAYRSDSSRS